jgi:phosphoribosylformylglycinamidine synthase I
MLGKPLLEPIPMKLEEVKVCILRVGGTNCDAETKRAFKDVGVKAEVIHLNDVVRNRNLLDYHVLVFPGGFSYGDYVRAGVILAKEIAAKLDKDLKQFVREERPILGICNGFQVLVEACLLPGFDGSSELPQACLATNLPTGYRCIWIHLKHENKGKCVFTRKVKETEVLRIPIAHGEGRFTFDKRKEDEFLKRLYESDQLVFRYCTEEGEPAEGKFPINPNGAFHDIAGICDSSGTVLGLMPHPERAYYGWQQPNWTKRERVPKYGDGRLIFESIAEYLTKKF